MLIVTYTQVYREYFDKFKNVCFKNWKFCNVLNVDVVLKTDNFYRKTLINGQKCEINYEKYIRIYKNITIDTVVIISCNKVYIITHKM